MSTTRPLVWLLLPAGVAAALGLLALLGWVMGLPLLASFGQELIPMSPSTAVLLVIYGLAVCWRCGSPLRDRAFWLQMGVGWLGTLAALLLFVLSSLDIHLEIERLGLYSTYMIHGAGYMSPVSAFCFLLVGLAFLASLSHSAACPPWRAALTLGTAGMLLVICYLFLLAYCFGEPLLYGSSFIPPALNTILALVMLGLTLPALANHPSRLLDESPAGGHRTAYALGSIFVLLAAGIVASGYIHYRHFEKQYRTEVDRQLSVIAGLKVEELTQYRSERLADAAIFFNNPAFSSLVRACFVPTADTDASHAAILNWLAKFQTHNQYDHVRLLDAQGVARLSVPGGLDPPGSDTVLAAADVMKSGQMAFRDFYRNARDQRVYLQILVPILNEPEANRSLGVVVLRIDPETWLYPLINHWPTPSPTAETLLVRRDGNEVVFLNELRFKTHTALNFRASLDRTDLPAVQVALGREGVMERIDYQGVAVVAALCRIPDSPWLLVARMNAAEVYAPIRARLWQMVVLVSALLIAAGACVGLVWRRQRARFYENQAAAAEVLRQSLHEKEMLLKEIHHRVKNNLQIISSLLRLQAGQIDHATTKTVLQNLQNRVSSMALIHEHLYLSKDIASVDQSTYIQSLSRQLFRSLPLAPDAVQLHLDLASVHLDIDQAIPCGLLVNELVPNSLEHAFPLGRHGDLWIELKVLAGGQSCRLRVADNGVGLPPNFALMDLSSLGLKLVTDLARQLGGRLEIGPGPGAQFEVEFKLSQHSTSNFQ